MTKVIFRKIKNHKSSDLGDGIIAFFPPVERGKITSYMHYGQHSDASIDFYRKNTMKATSDEYRNLLNELETLVGYDNLQIMQKIS